MEKHAVRLAQAGGVGIVTNGSNKEAAYHLTPSERAKATKITLSGPGFANTSLIVEASNHRTLQRCYEATGAVGDAARLMVPSFFKWAISTPTIERYFTKAAGKSLLP